MTRKIIGVLAGLSIWLAIALLAGFMIRNTWPEYVSVAGAMAFTFPMQIARLAIAAVATLVMGAVTARITRSVVASLTPGFILLLFFIPEHVILWHKFPLWYHLWFLATLVPLTYLGSSISRIGTPVPGSASQSLQS
jgi:hypothetical protein